MHLAVQSAAVVPVKETGFQCCFLLQNINHHYPSLTTRCEHADQPIKAACLGGAERSCCRLGVEHFFCRADPRGATPRCPAAHKLRCTQATNSQQSFGIFTEASPQGDVSNEDVAQLIGRPAGDSADVRFYTVRSRLMLDFILSQHPSGCRHTQSIGDPSSD